MEKKTVDVLGQDAALLSVCEVGLGSILHGLHLPPSGYLLSLNQSFLLSRTIYQTQHRTAAFEVSTSAALLKSLSPAGKKLTPMLAIAMQGAIMTIANLVFGCGLIGVAIGSAMASTWAFIQPALIYFFLFGKDIYRAIEFFFNKVKDGLPEAISVYVTAENMIALVIGIILLKMFFAVLLALLAKKIPETRFQKWQNQLIKAASATKREKSIQEPNMSRWRLALKDLTNPLFMISLLLTILFSIYVDSSTSQLIWKIIRPIALGFLLFFAFRSLPIDRWAERSPTFAHALMMVRKLLGIGHS